MKRTIALLLFAATVTLASAQDFPPQGPRMWGDFPQMMEAPTPEQIATRQADALDRLVSLTEKQYKKIYKFHRNMAQAEENRRLEGPMGGGMPMGMGGGPGMGGGMPMGGGPGMGGGRPPMGGPQFGGPNGERPQMPQDLKEQMEERQRKIEKKYRKVLTPEQYSVWESHEQERLFREAMEHPEKSR